MEKTAKTIKALPVPKGVETRFADGAWWVLINWKSSWNGKFIFFVWMIIHWVNWIHVGVMKHKTPSQYYLQFTILMEVHCLFQDLIYLQIGMCLRTIRASWVPWIPAKKLWSSTIVVRYYFLLLLIYFRGSWYLDLSLVSPDITSSYF